MEHRIILTHEEAFELSSKLEILSTVYLKDEYTGLERIGTDNVGVTIKDYETPIKGVIHKYSSKCKLDGIENIWFEFKWTANKSRFEIEFEGEVPDEFKSRPNIKGWEILREKDHA